MRRNFSTLADSNYLPKLLVMLQSLIRESLDRHTIHVLAMDEACEAALREFNLPGVMVYSLKDFESMTGMDKVRATRSFREYCWSCASVFTEFVAPACSNHVTYLDADLMFFSDPELVFTEIGAKSIGVTPHRFALKDERRLLPNGRYNVQWVTFHGDIGRDCLKRWARKCKEWCYAANVDGKFGDQGYLDAWPSDYPGEVCEIQNPGVGLAPWNIANYRVDKVEGQVFADNHSLIFYHYHEFQELQYGLFKYTGWKLRESDKELIYTPYVKAYQDAKKVIESCKVVSA